MHFTHTRRRALEILLYAEAHNRTVYESNCTTKAGHEEQRLTVYWQTRRTLEDSGLITSRLEHGWYQLELTGFGRAVVLELLAVSA